MVNLLINFRQSAVPMSVDEIFPSPSINSSPLTQPSHKFLTIGRE
jgi:hypothetical protein